VKLMLIFTLL